MMDFIEQILRRELEGQNGDDRPAMFALSWIVFFAAVVAQFLLLDPLLGLYDEGIILYGAERVAHGDVPYRDFWTMYGPGQFYLLSTLYSVFGTSDLVLRITGILIKGAIAALAVTAVARFTSKTVALISGIATLFLLVGVRNDGFPIFPALAFALVSILLLEHGIRRGLGFIVLSGVCTGIAATFRHDLGAYTAASIGLVVVLLQLLLSGRQHYKRAIKHAFVQLAAYAGGILFVLAPVFALLVHAVPLRDLYDNLIAIPAQVYPATRALPFPSLGAIRHPFSFDFSQLPVYVPYIAALLATIIEVRYVHRLRHQGTSFATLVAGGWALIPLLVVVSLLFTLKGIVRVSTVHMSQSLVISIMLLAIAATRVGWLSRKERYVLSPWFAIALFLLGLPLAKEVGGSLKAILSQPDNLLTRCASPVLPRLRCVSADADYLFAAQYVRSHSSKDDLIYVGTGRHDRIMINAISFYFMAERHSVTRWHELHPGIQTTASVQNAILGEMQAKVPRFVVLDSRWDNAEEPNDSALSSGVHVLDDYLRMNFEEVQRFGSVRILAAKERPRQKGSEGPW